MKKLLHKPVRSKHYGGAEGADSLGAIQSEKKKLSKRICIIGHHAWNVSKFSKRCNKCGLEVERNDIR